MVNLLPIGIQSFKPVVTKAVVINLMGSTRSEGCRKAHERVGWGAQGTKIAFKSLGRAGYTCKTTLEVIKHHVSKCRKSLSFATASSKATNTIGEGTQPIPGAHPENNYKKQCQLSKNGCGQRKVDSKVVPPKAYHATLGLQS